MGAAKYFLTYINIILEIQRSLTTLFGRNNAKIILILETNQLTDTNRTRMEHLLLTSVTIGSKDLAIGIARLGDKIIAEYNRASTSIDIWGHVDRYLPCGTWKSGNKMNVDFGRNMNEKIGMNPSRVTEIPHPQY